MIQTVAKENMKQEYGILCQRLFPNPQTPTPFGSTWCVVEPSGATLPHQHHEGETFFIFEGEGEMTIGDTTSSVKKGDVVYIPAFSNHVLKNSSATAPLNFLSVWWE